MRTIRRFFPLLILSCLITGFSTSLHAKSGTETSGDLLAVALPLIAFGSTYAMEDEEGRTQFGQSFFTTVAVTYGLKYSVRKKRPDGSDNLSFPSGHTSSAFQAASFIHIRYGWKYGLPAYMAASYVGWTRVREKRHFIEDVLAGAALGILSNIYFTEPYPGVSVNPLASHESYGVNVSLRW